MGRQGMLGGQVDKLAEDGGMHEGTKSKPIWTVLMAFSHIVAFPRGILESISVPRTPVQY